MSNLTCLDFEQFKVRMAVSANGSPLFCIKDVCKVLGIIDSKTVVEKLKTAFDMDYDGGGISPPIETIEVHDNMGRMQPTLFTTEPGLYYIIFLSRKPIAKTFRSWVFGKVIPQIRKTGSYNAAPEPATLGPDKELLQLEQSKLQFKAVELLREINGPNIAETNPRIAQVINDFAVRQIGSGSGSGDAPALPTERFMGVVERAEALGYSPYLVSKHCSQLGKYIATRYRSEFAKDPSIETRIHNGRMTNMKVYSSSQWCYIDAWIEEFFGSYVQVSDI